MFCFGHFFSPLCLKVPPGTDSQAPSQAWIGRGAFCEKVVLLVPHVWKQFTGKTLKNVIENCAFWAILI